MNTLPVSVLISIYSATTADELNQCFSSLSKQTNLADEIVLVWDGPVDSSVKACIEQHELVLPLHHYPIARHRGLGPALKDGLAACSNELIARVDSDDWSVPTRFEKQATFLCDHPEVSVLGGWLKEWYRLDNGRVSSIRKCPLDFHSINKTAKFRNPINHPTVMFRKSHVLSCGNYESCDFFEDYLLWAKMLKNGYALRNLPEIFVETQVDLSYFQRRGGLRYVKHELTLIKRLWNIGFLSVPHMIIFFLSRVPIRLLPSIIRKQLYRLFLRR